MTADTIIQLITVLLGSGGLIAIFLVSEKKTAAMLENIAKANEEWKKIIDREPPYGSGVVDLSDNDPTKTEDQ